VIFLDIVVLRSAVALRVDAIGSIAIHAQQVATAVLHRNGARLHFATRACERRSAAALHGSPTGSGAALGTAVRAT
jgi:hypothetical protein